MRARLSVKRAVTSHTRAFAAAARTPLCGGAGGGFRVATSIARLPSETSDWAIACCFTCSSRRPEAPSPSVPRASASSAPRLAAARLLGERVGAVEGVGNVLLVAKLYVPQHLHKVGLHLGECRGRVRRGTSWSCYDGAAPPRSPSPMTCGTPPRSPARRLLRRRPCRCPFFCGVPRVVESRRGSCCRQRRLRRPPRRPPAARPAEARAPCASR